MLGRLLFPLNLLAGLGKRGLWDRRDDRQRLLKPVEGGLVYLIHLIPFPGHAERVFSELRNESELVGINIETSAQIC